MAKIKHNNFIDTVDSIVSVSKERGSLHLYAEDETLSGRHLTLNGNNVLHFGTCGYLGLEQHPNVKRKAIEAIERFGTQFPMSRTYVFGPLYKELENKIRTMYNADVVISKNCTLSHLATIPIIVQQSDLVILDHQVHSSVQDAVKKLLSQGVTVEMIRHNNLEMLEALIKKKRGKFDKIWYMADGVYSMYGDFAPIQDMIALAEKYEELYLYVDDAHGMSWAGKHGTGYVMSQMGNKLYRKMILTANLGKGFGACGGLSLFPNKKLYTKVNNFGGPLTFSVQIEPATLGAAIASADIHLSDEIYELQDELQDKIAYCNALLKRTDLPLVEENMSPIFFIGMGTMDMGNHLVSELIKDGIYLNMATFPAVPAKNSGLRLTISTHNTIEDIETMVQKLHEHFHKSLEATGQTLENIQKAFRMKAKDSALSPNGKYTKDKPFVIKKFDSIEQIDANLWNQHIGNRAMYDWNGLRLFERSFQGNAEIENNWDFKYYIIEDHSGNIILMTFFVTALHKEDMFSRASISLALENERKFNPYHLTSKGILMGSLITEGNHLYLDRLSPHWKKAMQALMDELYKEQEKEQASNIMFRDLEAGDKEMEEFMIENGFVKVDLPESCVVENLGWETEEQYVASLSKESRKNFKRYIKRYEDYCDVTIKDRLSDEELQHAIELFKNVKDRNYAINLFLFPDKVFYEMNNDPNWEFIILTVKEEYQETDKPVVICFCHKNTSKVYNFLLTGIDYEQVYEYSVYRQSLYQIVKRANELGCKKANLGISATVEKKRVGAKLHPKVGYYQAKDNYAMEMMETTIAIEKD